MTTEQAVSAAPARKKRSQPNRKLKGGKGHTLARRFVGGPPSHKESVRRARDTERIAARRKRAWELYLMDMTYQQVGDALGVSIKTAHEDVHAVYHGILERGYLDADLLRVRQQGELDALKRASWPAAIRGKGPGEKKAAADVILGALAREARLNGLDRQKEGGFSPEAVLAMLRGLVADLLAAFTETEHRRRIAAIFRQRAGTAIDAEPAKEGTRGAVPGVDAR